MADHFMTFALATCRLGSCGRIARDIGRTVVPVARIVTDVLPLGEAGMPDAFGTKSKKIFRQDWKRDQGRHSACVDGRVVF